MYFNLDILRGIVMKRILTIILSLILILASVTGCNSAQIDNTPNTSVPSQMSSCPSSGYESQGSEPTQETSLPTTPTIPDPPPADSEPLFQYDPYMISADAQSYYTEREYSLYCKMIDSILSYNGVVEGLASEDEAWKLWRFLLSEFVPVRSLIQTYADSSEPFLYENSTLILKFKANEVICEENYRSFEKIMNEALSLIQEDDSDWSHIAKLYLYVSEHMIYGSPYQTYGVHPDLYNCIIYKMGECVEYASYLNMLANQIGFETILARSLGKDGFEGADHAWSMICIGGQWYHFDACWQAPHLAHDNMDYFAFSTQERYDSLASNNSWGMTGEVEMFCQHNYTNQRTKLPYCETGMSEDQRVQLYLSVIDDYRAGISKDIPDNMLETYIDSAIEKVQNSLANGETVGIQFEIKNGTLNSAVKNLILTYSPEDLENYPELENDADRCIISTIILKHIDQSDFRSMLYFIIKEDIVIDQSVELILL